MKLETQMLIAKNIRTLRTSKCISQTDFAKMVGVSRSTYASYELGNRVPDAETLFLYIKKRRISYENSSVDSASLYRLSHVFYQNRGTTAPP